MKADFLGDTNLLIYIHEGNEIVRPFLNYNIAISFITEIEMLGHAGLSSGQEKKIKQLISDCWYFDWSRAVKEKTIDLRKNHRIKLPDAIIAATAITFDLPLISADKGLKKIDELDLIILDF